MKKQAFITALLFFIGFTLGYTLLDILLWKQVFNYQDFTRTAISSFIIACVMGVIDYNIRKANNKK
jgi:hypothetical protein